MTPITDTHQHLWDLTKFDLPWLTDHATLGRSHVMSDYLRETAGLDVVRTVYMEVDVELSQQVAEADYVIDLCQRDDNPMVAAVIGGRPASDGFKAYVDRFKNSPYIKGVRHVLHGGPVGYVLTPEFVRGVRLLGEAGLQFDICIRPGELLDAAKLIDLCPDTRFVLDHCGNANVQQQDRTQWQRDIAEVARRETVVCKISGIIASANPDSWSADDLAPIVNHCAEVFGKDRVIFASDWPVCTQVATFRQWVEALNSIVSEWSEEDRCKLFHANAGRFYELD